MVVDLECGDNHRGIAAPEQRNLILRPSSVLMDSLNHRVGAWASRFGQKREHEVVPAGAAAAMEPRVVAKSSGDAAD